MEAVYKILEEVLAHTNENKILDNHFMTELREKIFVSIQSQHKKDPKYKTNYMKKLAYFIKTVSMEILKIMNFSEINVNEVYKHMYCFLLKKGGNYLRQDSLQILISDIKEINNNFNN